MSNYLAFVMPIRKLFDNLGMNTDMHIDRFDKKHLHNLGNLIDMLPDKQIHTSIDKKYPTGKRFDKRIGIHLPHNFGMPTNKNCPHNLGKKTNMRLPRNFDMQTDTSPPHNFDSSGMILLRSFDIIHNQSDKTGMGHPHNFDKWIHRSFGSLIHMQSDMSDNKLPHSQHKSVLFDMQHLRSFDRLFHKLSDNPDKLFRTWSGRLTDTKSDKPDNLILHTDFDNPDNLCLSRK